MTGKGLTLYHSGKNEEAIKWYDKALAINPNYIIALNNKGRALGILGKHEEDKIWYNKADVLEKKLSLRDKKR